MSERLRVILTEPERESRFHAIERIWSKSFDVIINVNLLDSQGRETARYWMEKGGSWLNEKRTFTQQNIFARMPGVEIRQSIQLDNNEAQMHLEHRRTRGPQSLDSYRAIHSIWPDFSIRPCLTKSIATVKADAAQSFFTALGNDITWAVVDSGIAADHPHFVLHGDTDMYSDLHKDAAPADLPAGKTRLLPTTTATARTLPESSGVRKTSTIQKASSNLCMVT